MYYKTCPNYGAHLDPDELCDCLEKEEGRPVKEAPNGHGEKDMGYVSVPILPENLVLVNERQADLHRPA